MDQLIAWLSPRQRAAIYAMLTGAAALAAASGIISSDVATSVVSLTVAVLEVFALLLAMVKAKAFWATATYASAAAVVAALKALGIIRDGDESHILDILSHAVAFIPLALAVFRTDPATPTGQPADEYVAEHGAGVRE